MTKILSRLRNLTARHIISALFRDGFVLDRQAGSHRIYYDPRNKRRVDVTYHASSETFRRKTLKSMIEQAEWTAEDLKRLELI